MAEMNAYMQGSGCKRFYKRYSAISFGPLWEAIPAMMNKTPEPHAVAYLWTDELLKKKLWEAAEIFTPDRGGERRAIYFQNPGLTYRQPWGWASTTQTLYAAVQLLFQVKWPLHIVIHKVLFVLLRMGKVLIPLLKGERIFMEEGDFLITPKNLWHGHGHVGERTDDLDGCS